MAELTTAGVIPVGSQQSLWCVPWCLSWAKSWGGTNPKCCHRGRQGLGPVIYLLVYLGWAPALKPKAPGSIRETRQELHTLSTDQVGDFWDTLLPPWWYPLRTHA